MTTPLIQDRPDWMPTLSASVVNVFTSSPTQVAALVNYGRKYVGTHPYVFVKFNAPGGGVRLILTWYDAPTGGNQLGTNEANALGTFGAEGSFAAQGPYVQIDIEVSATPLTFSISIFSALHPLQSGTSGAGSRLIQQDAVTVGAGATVTVDSIFTRWGWGYYSALLLNAAAYDIQLYARDFVGNLQTLDKVNSIAGPTRTPIIIPPRPLRLVVFNADPVARQLDATVVIHPIAGI